MSTDADLWTPGGEQGPTGPAGPQGPAGPELELQTTATHVQWRVVGDTTWINLVAIADLVGPQGNAGPQGPAGSPGPQGDQVQLQTTATHIQWKLTTDATWINLIAISSLEGPAGVATEIHSGLHPPDNGIGVDGDYLIIQDHPDDGVVMYGPKAVGDWGTSYIILEGPAGPISDRVVLNGNGAPAGSTGTINDFYIDITNWDIYGPKTSGGWGTGTSLIGPAAALEDLSDVDLTTVAPAEGDILVYDGLDWVPGDSPYSDFGELNITQNTAAIAITAAVDTTLYTNTDYIQITGVWDVTPHGILRGVTQQANSITIAKTGTYRIEVWLNVATAANNTKVGVKFAVNGSIGLGRRPSNFLATPADDDRQITAFGLHEFTAGDVLTLWFAADKSTNITFKDCVFSVTQIV